MISKITCFVVIALVCLAIPAFAQTGNAITGSAGIDFGSGGDSSSVYLNFDKGLSSHDVYDVSASVGVFLGSGGGSSFDVMLNAKSKPASNTYFGGGIGLFLGSGGGSDFGYQLFAVHMFSQKTFGELRLFGRPGDMTFGIGVGMKL